MNGIKKERLIRISPYKVPERPKLFNRTNKALTLASTSSISDENSKVKVFVRVRPLNPRECNANSKSIVSVIDDKSLVFDPEESNEPFFFRGIVQKGRDINRKAKRNMTFEFDNVFNDEVSNEEVFESTTKNIVKSIFEGYNCCVFAYGATGAGKTFTMLGTERQPGITYLTIVELLKTVESSMENMKVTLGVSYIEVYNENVRDLLHPNAGMLQLREEGGIVIVSGLVVEKINSSDHLFSLLAAGNQNRSQHPTDSNSESSRSHAIFQVHVRMEERTTLKLAKLSMIDLAGSERGAATGYRGARFKEGSNINKSLLALGNCINSLAEGLKHIPYRDSKLTRILKDSLGGNCQTMMIANISPSSFTFEDTYNTLKYATRAKCIKSKIMKNVMKETFSVAHYKKLVEELQDKIAALEKGAIPDYEKWIEKIQTIMEDKKKIHKEILTLQSQERLTEWRLTHKGIAQALYNPSLLDNQSLNRINCGISQLKARSDSFRNRIGEYKPVQEALEGTYNALINEIQNNEKIYNILKPTIELHKELISSEEQKQCLAHMDKIIRLQAKQEESHSSAINTVVPVLHEFYSLLRGFGHVTGELTDKYQEALRSLDGVKSVTWVVENDEDIMPLHHHNLRLSLSRLQVIPEVSNGTIKSDSVDYGLKNYVLKESNKFIKQTVGGGGSNKSTTPLIKSKTFIKPKTTLLNKENIRLSGNSVPKTNSLTPTSGFKQKTLSKGQPLRSHPYQNLLLNPRSSCIKLGVEELGHTVNLLQLGSSKALITNAINNNQGLVNIVSRPVRQKLRFSGGRVQKKRTQLRQ